MQQISALDRFILAVAPQWGMRRLRARELSRHYEAASGGRRTSGWARTGANADLLVAQAMVELRMHARDLTRNNAWARRGQRTIANNVVGWGLMPKASGTDPKQNAAADAVWRKWSESTECETEGRHTFSGLQHLAVKAIYTDGEVLLRRRSRLPTDGLYLPMQVQVLEADHLDQAQSALTSISGGPIVNGVEFDPIGRRSAYWLFPTHPGSGRNVAQSIRVPAAEVRHVAYTERPGQTRGISWLGASIVNMKDLDEYEDAELMKQKIAACFSAFVTDDGGGSALVGDQSLTDELVETLEPGMITRLAPGKKVEFGNPPQMTSDALPTRTLRKIAAGLGVSYEDLTGDYSLVNFSSARMARIAHWGNVRDWQNNMLIPLLCNGVWDWVMATAVVTGAEGLRVAPPAEWTCPPMPMIEPDKEGLAYSRLVRNGVMTFSDMVREQGGDWKAFVAEYKSNMADLDAAGIRLDSDVRAVSQAGLTQERVGLAGKGGPPESPAAPPPEPREIDIDEDVSPELEALIRGLE